MGRKRPQSDNAPNPSELRAKRLNVTRRVQWDAARAKMDDTLVTKFFDVLDSLDDPSQEQRFLAYASTTVNRVENDKDMLLGRQVRDGARQGAAQTNRTCQSRHLEWQSAADELWRNDPTASKLEVAKKIADEMGEKFHTIRQVINRPASD